MRNLPKKAVFFMTNPLSTLKKGLQALRKRVFIQCAIDRYEADVTPSMIYNIDQLEAMRIADTAWREVDTTTIRNCWCKAGILPDSLLSEPQSISPPSIPISSLVNENPLGEAEKELEATLDALQATGVLQSGNRISLEALLNPQNESDDMDESTDEEIFQAVMDGKKGEGDEKDEDEDDFPAEIRPSRTEALRAAITLQKYVQDINDPFARKSEGILASFGRQTRLAETQSMKSTRLTEYFTNN